MNAPARTQPTGGHVPTFPCPKCRQAHPWSAEYAGRTARCTCGQIMKIPAVLQDPEDEGPRGHWRPPQAPGYGQGYAQGYPQGYAQGYPQGHAQAYPQSYPQGHAAPPPLPTAAAASGYPGMPAGAGIAAQVPSFLRMPTAPPPGEGLSA